jgi:peptidase C39-like protein
VSEYFPDDGIGPSGYDDPVADVVTGDDTFAPSPELINFDSGRDMPLVGDPGTEMGFWHEQAAPDTCAVVSQEMVLESLTGQDFDESALAAEAEANGWYVPGGGTPTWHMDSLLEAHGVATETHFNTSLDDVAGALDRGDKVLVSLDSGEIWSRGGDPLLEDMVGDPIPGQGADHAVEVTGIVDTASGRMVVVNDPGHPEGRGEMVPIEQFQNAWADSGAFAVFAGPGADDSVDAFGGGA